jgi:hypothetical protein
MCKVTHSRRVFVPVLFSKSVDWLDATIHDGREGRRNDYTLNLLAVLLGALEDADSSVDSWVY